MFFSPTGIDDLLDVAYIAICGIFCYRTEDSAILVSPEKW